MNKKTEIKRKFLLRRLPRFSFEKQIEVSQYYCVLSDKNKEILKPYFPSLTINESLNFELRLEKIRFDNFYYVDINEQHDNNISYTDFSALLEDTQSTLSKIRHIFSYVDNLKWKIDCFNDPIRLVIAEIEIPDLSYDLSIPSFIKRDLISEVTEDIAFANSKLALPLRVW